MMKRATAILLVLGILLAGSHAVISVHYCGGRIADTKVSLSGDIASCGMEGDEGTCPMPGSNLDRHCCEDQVNIAGIVNQYTAPSSEPERSLNNYSNIHIIQIHGLYPVSVSPITVYTSYYPPGYGLTNTVSLDKICVFRI
jgi:hypothetical protein